MVALVQPLISNEILGNGHKNRHPQVLGLHERPLQVLGLPSVDIYLLEREVANAAPNYEPHGSESASHLDVQGVVWEERAGELEDVAEQTEGNAQ